MRSSTREQIARAVRSPEGVTVADLEAAMPGVSRAAIAQMLFRMKEEGAIQMVKVRSGRPGNWPGRYFAPTQPEDANAKP